MIPQRRQGREIFETFCPVESLLYRGIVNMNHEEVVRSKLTERYFLDELEPGKRDEFEDHYFDCPKCALDVRAASVFVEQSKSLLAESGDKSGGPVRVPARKRWLPWLGWVTPAWAGLAVALLLAVIGYQNLVIVPRLMQAANRPQALPWLSINVGMRGSVSAPLVVKRGGAFALLVNIPPDSRYLDYVADLYNPAGRLEWSVSIPANLTDDVSALEVPGTNREAGTYSLVLNGVNAARESKEVGRATFELQIQK
jgi:anti-sigma factor RsiW